MKECPSPFELEAYFVGESSAEIDAHIMGCESCRTYVQTLGEERSQMLAKRSVTDFLGDPVVRDEFEKTEAKTWWRRMLTMPIFVPALITAAALIVWVQSPSNSIDGDRSNPGRLIPDGSSLVTNDTLRLKGRAITLIVERKRGAKVEAFTTTVPVQKDDTIGISLHLAQPATLSVALQDLSSGQWIRLARSKRFSAGRSTVTKEASQAVTDNETRGRVVVGDPADVEAVMVGAKPNRPLIELSIVPEASF